MTQLSTPTSDLDEMLFGTGPPKDATPQSSLDAMLGVKAAKTAVANTPPLGGDVDLDRMLAFPDIAVTPKSEVVATGTNALVAAKEANLPGYDDVMQQLEDSEKEAAGFYGRHVVPQLPLNKRLEWEGIYPGMPEYDFYSASQQFGTGNGMTPNEMRKWYSDKGFEAYQWSQEIAATSGGERKAQHVALRLGRMLEYFTPMTYVGRPLMFGDDQEEALAQLTAHTQEQGTTGEKAAMWGGRVAEWAPLIIPVFNTAIAGIKSGAKASQISRAVKTVSNYEKLLQGEAGRQKLTKAIMTIERNADVMTKSYFSAQRGQDLLAGASQTNRLLRGLQPVPGPELAKVGMAPNILRSAREIGTARAEKLAGLKTTAEQASIRTRAPRGLRDTAKPVEMPERGVQLPLQESEMPLGAKPPSPKPRTLSKTDAELPIIGEPGPTKLASEVQLPGYLRTRIAAEEAEAAAAAARPAVTGARVPAEAIAGTKAAEFLPSTAPVFSAELTLPQQLDEISDFAMTEAKLGSRWSRLQIVKSQMQAERWSKELPAYVFEDIGAGIEGIGNLKIEGDTIKAVNGRLFETPKALQFKKTIQASYEKHRQTMNSHLRGLTEEDYIRQLKDYLPHIYKESKPKINEAISAWVGRTAPASKRRSLPTLAEAVNELGLTPVTQNALELDVLYSKMNYPAVAAKRFVEVLKNTKTAQGVPLVSTTEYAGYKTMKNSNIMGFGKTVYVHPEVYGPAKAILRRPFTNRAMKAFLQIAAAHKGAVLNPSFFHEVALKENALAFLGYKGSLGNVFRWTPGNVRKGKKLLQDPEFVEDAIMSGLTVEPTVDVLSTEYLKGLNSLKNTFEAVKGPLPLHNFVVKNVTNYMQWYHKHLWGTLHPGWKSYIYYTLKEQALAGKLGKQAQNMPVKDLSEGLARVINHGFGGQEWIQAAPRAYRSVEQAGGIGNWMKQMPRFAETQLFGHPEVRKLLSGLMLAPDWTYSNIMIGGQPFAKSPLARKIGRRYWKNMAISQFIFHEGLNVALNGYPTWHNEPGHEADVDITNIVRMMPNYDPSDQTRHYAHGGKQWRELYHWYDNMFGTFLSKLSPGARELTKQIAGIEPGSQFPAEWKREEYRETKWHDPFTSGVQGVFNKSNWENPIERGKSLIKSWLPYSVNSNQFAFAFAKSKGMTRYKGMTRLYNDMRKYAESEPGTTKKVLLKRMNDETLRAAKLNGVDPDTLFEDAMRKLRSTYYQSFWRAIEQKNDKEANRIEKRLRALGITPRHLREAAERRIVSRGDLKREDAVRGKRVFNTQ